MDSGRRATFGTSQASSAEGPTSTISKGGTASASCRDSCSLVSSATVSAAAGRSLWQVNGTSAARGGGAA